MTQGYVGLPPDGVGKKLHTNTHVVDTNEVHNQVYTLGDAEEAGNFQSVDAYGSAYVRFHGGGFEFDGFGKAKVSQETLLGEYVPEFDTLSSKYALVKDAAADEVYLPNEKSVLLRTQATGESIQKTTKKYHKYIAGTSQYILMTLNPLGIENGVRKEWGYMDDKNGLYFYIKEDSTWGVAVRSSVTGSVVDTFIPSTSFNGDPVDGTGISGITLSLSNSNIFWLDYQWLGVGAVRFGVITPAGNRIVLHTIKNANRNTTVYMASANLPVRYKLSNISAGSVTSQMKMHNAVVLADGQLDYVGDQKGRFETTASLTTDFSCPLSIKQRNEHKTKDNHSACIPRSLSVVSDTSVVVSIQKDADVSGGVYDEVSTESTLVKTTGNTLNAEGVEVFYQVLPAGTQTISLMDIFSYEKEHLDSFSEYSVLVKSVSGTGTISLLSLSWDEILMS